MNSLLAPKAARQPVAPPQQHDLLVLWQNRTSRAIDVIGRLKYDGEYYSFQYTKNSSLVPGFKTLPGLRSLHTNHRSERLFPLFAQRVMDPSRVGYEKYISQLGLDEDSSTPWEQILRSGGRREGDTLQFLPTPMVRDGQLESSFLAHGVRWISTKNLLTEGGETRVSPEEQEYALRNLHPGAPLGLLAETGNPSNPNAALLLAGNVPVAYTPNALTSIVRRVWNTAELSAVRVNGPDAPPHLRLVVSLRATVGSGFAIDPEGLWEPIGGEAWSN